MTLWINPSRPTSPPICLELDHPLCGHTCVRGSDGEANTFGSFLFDTKPSGKRPHVTSRVAVTRASLLGTRASLLVTRASLLVTSDKSIVPLRLRAHPAKLLSHVTSKAERNLAQDSCLFVSPSFPFWTNGQTDHLYNLIGNISETKLEVIAVFAIDRF